jgi:hypothetical protein
MRKVQFTAVFWTLFLAIPFTALALSALALATDHWADIAAAVTSFGTATSVGGRGWNLELSGRWPEIAGMIIGQLVIMIILIVARQSRMAENNKENK